MWQAVALVVLFLALVAAGLLFVNHSLYKDFEGKDPVVQVAFGRGRRPLSMLKPCGLYLTSDCILQALFAVVFALSVSLLLLILSEILGVLSHRSVAKAFSKFVCLARLARQLLPVFCVQNKFDYLESRCDLSPGHHSCSFALLPMLQIVSSLP